MYNKIQLIGHVGQDIEIKEVQDKVVGRFSIATTESYKDNNGDWQDKVEWHTVIAWRKSADQLKNVKKGSLFFIEGKQTNRKYEDKEGNQKYVSEVVGSLLRNLDKKKPTSVPLPTDPPKV